MAKGNGCQARNGVSSGPGSGRGCDCVGLRVYRRVNGPENQGLRP